MVVASIVIAFVVAVIVVVVVVVVFLNFCSNNYLGLSNLPEVVEAGIVFASVVIAFVDVVF